MREHEKKHRKSEAEQIKEYLVNYNYDFFKKINNNTIAIHKDVKVKI